ncbi:MAG: hypothetical protein J2P16_06735 [Mycobacterium sp.]|nr:hypothetical protein [Mycobacterium sp.]
MMSALIIATLAVVVCSLWIRRHTWASRWEAGASLNIALQGCAVLLMSPWASATFGPPLHNIFGRWNIEDLLGHLCLIVAATAIIQHGLARLVDGHQLQALLHRYIEPPLQLGVPLLVAVFVIADEGYHPDMFPAHVRTVWLGAYWLVLSALLIYLFSYAARLLLILRADPRSKPTVDLYLIAVTFGVAANVIQTGTAWAGIDITLPVWLCACLGVIGFAYASARSWRAKVSWFEAPDNPPS